MSKVPFRSNKVRAVKRKNFGFKSSLTDENLQILIDGLTLYKANGVVDPWVLKDGTIIEPLDVLLELKQLRKKAGL